VSLDDLTPEEWALLSPEALAAMSKADLERVQAFLEMLDQDQQAGKVLWLCDRPGCNGAPHPGRQGPHARLNQRPPADDIEWDTWLLLAGRGFGKSRTGAEWSWRQAQHLERGALVGPTAADTRDILVEGESGILASAPSTFRPVYEPSKRKLTYPNGAVQHLYSADEPDRMRGPQHHYGWADELAAWRKLQYAWDMLQMGMRLGAHPQVCVTTTPRPLPLIKALIKDPLAFVTKGTTYDNLANLAPTFRRAVVEKYEGTTLGKQELDADILDDMPGALIARAVIERNRRDSCPELLLTVVAMDPAGTGQADETGIIGGGHGVDGRDYITHDRSAKLSPRESAKAVWRLYKEIDADCIVYEDNFGKEWVREVLRSVWMELHPGVPTPVMHQVTATKGKKLRAQPVVMRYEQNKVSHVGVLGELEDQYTTWIPEEDQNSPDRVDAAVHLVTFLMKRYGQGVVSIASPHGVRPGGRSPAAMGRPLAARRPMPRPFGG
jgi:phage terminase large subunit-like protein